MSAIPACLSASLMIQSSCFWIRVGVRRRPFLSYISHLYRTPFLNTAMCWNKVCPHLYITCCTQHKTWLKEIIVLSCSILVQFLTYYKTCNKFWTLYKMWRSGTKKVNFRPISRITIVSQIRSLFTVTLDTVELWVNKVSHSSPGILWGKKEIWNFKPVYNEVEL